MKSQISKKQVIALLAAILVLIVSTLVNINVTTNGGSVKVTRVTYIDDTGAIVSGQLYVPATATAENPAPAVLTNHGGGASAEAQSSYNIELSQRGYVVLSWDASNSGSSEASKDATHGGEATYKFVQSLDFVQKDQLATSGHSMGGVYSYMVAQNHPDNVKLEIPVGMNPGMNDVSYFGTNYVCIIGEHDESSLVRVDGDIHNFSTNPQYLTLFGMSEGESFEFNKVYGSYEEGTVRAFYIPNATHAGAMINTELLALYLNTVQTAVPAPNPIDGADQMWFYKDFAMIFQFAGLVAVLFIVASMLLKSAAFSSLVLPDRQPVGYKAKSAMWYVSMAVLLFVPTLLFIPFTTIAQKVDVTKVLQLDNTANGVAIWAVLSAVILFAYFLFYHFSYGSKNGGNLITYGLSTEAKENRITIAYLGKALAFAVLCIGITYLFYLVMYVATAGDIHLWLATLRPVTPIRVKYVPVYLFMQAPFYFAGTIAGRSISLNNGERSKGNGMRNSLILSLLISILGLAATFTIFEMVFRTTGTVIFPQNRGYIYAGAIFSMLPAFSVGNTINCYVTNKTNSIWAGLFTGIIWSTWVLVASNAIA